jgi:hypothetical protein
LITVVFILITELKTYATVYYVSNTGNDANSGITSTQAWKSISKVNRVFFKPGDQILFKRGDIWNGTINVRYSGKSNNPITFGAWGDGQNPKISGLTTVTEWTNEGNGIYSKSVAVESNPEIVTINEVQYAMGRTPNSDRYNPSVNDYYHIDTYAGTNSFTDNECNSAVTNWKGAEIIVRGSNYIQWGRFPITNHSGNILTFSNPNNYTNGIGFGYFIQNDLRTLDQFGEWYYGGGKLYMYFGLVSPSNFSVKVSTLNILFDINTQDFITIKDLHLEGANTNAIRTNTAAEAYNLTVENCYFDYNTIGIYGHIAPEMTINNCTFMRSSRMAILQTWYSDGTYFGHNKIDSTGLVIGLGLTTGSGVTNFYHGMGVLIDYSKKKYSKKSTIIEHNIVKNSGYSGIVFSGDGSIVRNNYVDSYCLIQSDGGGIYHGGNNDTNILIGNNIVLNGIINTDAVGMPAGNTHGSQYNIYLDYYSTGGIIIKNNTVAYTEGIGLMVHGSQNVTITNNVIYDCNVGIKFQELNGYGSPSRNITMNNNIVVAKNINDVCVWSRSITNDFNQYGAINNNFYAKTNDDTNSFATLINTWDETYRNFSNWKSFTKLDASSTFINIKQKEGEKEKLFYNNTNQTIWFSVGKSTFRNVTGEIIANSFSLEPFSSKIIIGKNINEINQKPQVSDQSFNIKTPLFRNDSIGKISAYDPDNDQILKYSIYKGNDLFWFALDSASGKLFIQNEFNVFKEITVELGIKVNDNSLNSLSDSAKIVIHIEGSDNSPPEITSFSIPSNVNSFYIPIESFIVVDDLGVKGYLLTTSPDTPALNDTSWSSTVPKYFQVSQQGEVTLYAWALDVADNISKSFSTSALITFPKMNTAFSEYFFEEKTGINIIDFKNLANGTIINEVNRVDGVIEDGVLFNGNGYINLGKNYGENIQDQITISLWLKPDSINSNLPIITHGGYYSNTFELYINADSLSIIFITNGTKNTAFIIEKIKQLWDGNWHHLAVTYNGRKKSIYLDGIIIAEAEDSGDLNSGFWNNLYIGASISPNDSSFFHGTMDEVKIYNFALKDDEIGVLYHSVNKIIKVIKTSEDVSVCEGENYLGWSNTGKYSRVLQRIDLFASGADSIITTNLIVHPNYKTRLETTICEDDTLVYYKQKFFKSGTYSITLQTVSGCDSIITLKLNVHPKYQITEEISILKGNEYLGWTTDGIYQRKLISVNGCDSVVTTNLNVVEFFTHTINFEKGWNIFSTYLNPTNPNFRSIVENLENQNILNVVQDEKENAYLNENNKWINGIGEIKITEGYKIRLNSQGELKITGLPIILPLTIPLNSGWNIISFPYQGNVNAMDVIQPLISEGILKKVLDERGNSIEFWGNKIGWINGIGNFKTGEGYLLEVNNAGVLNISVNYKKSTQFENNNTDTNHFTRIFEGNGFGHMNINITGLTESQLEVGDELAAYDGANCVGSVKLSNLNIANDIVSIQASISDKEVVNGFTEGHKIDLLAWRSKTNEEFQPKLMVIGGNAIYQKYGSVFFLLDVLNNVEKGYNILTNLNVYPNPVSNVLFINFHTIPEIGTQICLTDLTGKQILNMKAKTELVQLNINSQPVGVYLLKIISGKTSITKRIIKI